MLEGDMESMEDISCSNDVKRIFSERGVNICDREGINGLGNFGYGKAHPTIAVMKYWGKKDIEQNIPSGPSISFSLDKLSSETYVFHGDCMNVSYDELWVNGECLEINMNIRKVISLFKKESNDFRAIVIVSRNDFPIGCGLASSGSGSASVVLALKDFYGLEMSDCEMSGIARIGSGSGSRSIFSGVVVMDVCGISRRLCLWKEIRIIVIILCDGKKKVSSREGMIRTQLSSELYRYRIEGIMERYELMKESILKKDFNLFGELT
jgi:diphosphomevalonate decarboxylase